MKRYLKLRRRQPRIKLRIKLSPFARWWYYFARGMYSTDGFELVKLKQWGKFEKGAMVGTAKVLQPFKYRYKGRWIRAAFVRKSDSRYAVHWEIQGD